MVPLAKTPPRRFERYVALGDSSTEGLDDPDGQGGFRGWANRLAERIADDQGGLLYANLAVRGRSTRQILDQQLAKAVAMRPDLATVFSGTNDVVARSFDLTAFADDFFQLQNTLVAGGATVLSFTLPDLAPVMPLARWFTPRVLAMNEAVRSSCARSGAILVDMARHPVATDPRLWSADRLHANAAGHARIAAALAQGLGLPGSDDAWARPLPVAPRRSAGARFAAELSWVGHHLVPWLWQHARGVSSGDRQAAKRPTLQPWALH